MARLHRPPPPIPTEEHEETDENYGVWDENEFDDGEVYENYGSEEAGENEGNGSDYEEPDDPVPISAPQKPTVPVQPPIPVRQGARQAPVPTPAFLAPKADNLRVGGRISPNVSPAASERQKFQPPLPPVAIQDDEEMYEAVDSPVSPDLIDDGEVYSEVDDENLPQKPNAVTEKRALPFPPKAGVSRPPVPQPPTSLQPSMPPVPSVSPKLGRREVPIPPSVKSIPSVIRPFASARPTPQPSLPPPMPELLDPDPEEEAEEMYEEGDFYVEKEATPTIAAGKKPVPRPPQNDEEVEPDEEFYEEVPESNKPNGRWPKADRPIPPVPQSQPTPSAPSQIFAGSTRIPVEKLKAGLARLAEAKANAAADNQDDERSTESSGAGSLSGSALLDIKKMLKPVSRGESLNTPARPATVSVKRAESESSKLVKPSFEKKGSLLSEMKSRLESNQSAPGKQGTRLPTICNYEEAEPVKKSPAFDRKGVQNTAAAAAAAVKSTPTFPPPENSWKPPQIGKTANDGLSAPKVPALRASPSRSFPPNPDSNTNSDLKNSQTKVDLPPQLPKERKTPVPEMKRSLPPVPPAVPAAVPPPVSQDDVLEGLYSFRWYFSSIERQAAEKKILEINQDGAFLVRKSQRGGDANPYTLTLLFNGHVFNLHIRKRRDGKFALGNEKPDEHVFSSVEDLISFHNNNPIEVVGDARKNSQPSKVILKVSPKK